MVVIINADDASFSVAGSTRSLRSLQLLAPPPPPPTTTTTRKPYQGGGDDVRVQKTKKDWSRPAPFAPHIVRSNMTEEEDMTRDDNDNPMVCDSDALFSAKSKTGGVVADRQQRKMTSKVLISSDSNSSSNVNMIAGASMTPPRMSWLDSQLDYSGKGGGAKYSTPPRIPLPRVDEAMAAYSAEKRRGSHVRVRSRSPLINSEKKNHADDIGIIRSRNTLNGPAVVSIQAAHNDQHRKSRPNSSNSGGNNSNSSCYSVNQQHIVLVGSSKIYSRTLIPPTIVHNIITDLWTVTINTSRHTTKKQKTKAVEMSKISLKLAVGDLLGLSLPETYTANNNSTHVTNTNSNVSTTSQEYHYRNEKEARATAYALSPPIMIPFATCTTCTLCSRPFTFFTRPRHCRNCGIVICNTYNCGTTWSKRMIPPTYNIKDERTVTVCTSCNTLSVRFKNALLQGQYGAAMELYLTGNINLRVPYASSSSSGETMLPIHCAVEGGSEELLRWLVDVHYCPIYDMSSSAEKSDSGIIVAVNDVAEKFKNLAPLTNTAKEKEYSFLPTLKTSKGRSLINIAMMAKHVGIIKYLINEKKVSVYEVHDLKLALGAVEALAMEATNNDGGLLARDKSKRKLKKERTTNEVYDIDEDKENVQHRGAY